MIRNYGHYKMITFAQVLCVIRLALYTFISPKTKNAAVYISCIQIFHGFNFALFWAAAVDAIAKLTPKEVANSCLASLNIIYFTFSGIVGNSVVGYIYDLYGMYFVFIVGCITLTLNVLIFSLYKGNYHNYLYIK